MMDFLLITVDSTAVDLQGLFWPKRYKIEGIISPPITNITPNTNIKAGGRNTVTTYSFFLGCGGISAACNDNGDSGKMFVKINAILSSTGSTGSESISPGFGTVIMHFTDYHTHAM